MAIVDEFFILRRVSHTHTSDFSAPPAADVRLLGADLQPALLPVKTEIRQLARRMHGDVHRAAMQLLTQRQAQRFPLLEQQLVVTALQQLQEGLEPSPGS